MVGHLLRSVSLVIILSTLVNIGWTDKAGKILRSSIHFNSLIQLKSRTMVNHSLRDHFVTSCRGHSNVNQYERELISGMSWLFSSVFVQNLSVRTMEEEEEEEEEV